jgi:hypothetical protein
VPAISYSDLNQQIAPQPSWRFYCTLPTVAGTTLNGQTLSFLIESISIPFPGINFEAAPFNSSERQFPNLRTIGQIQMVLAENTSFVVIQFLEAWRLLIIDDNGNYGLPSAYKQPISLQPLDETGAANVTLTWEGCNPTVVDSYTFDGSSSHHVSCSVTFTVDQMDPITAIAT